MFSIFGLAQVRPIAGKPQVEHVAAQLENDVDGLLRSLDGVVERRRVARRERAVDAGRLLPQAGADVVRLQPHIVEHPAHFLRLAANLGGRRLVDVGYNLVVVKLDGVVTQCADLLQLVGEGDGGPDRRAEGVGARLDIPRPKAE
jgi:hypothetical protein